MKYPDIEEDLMDNFITLQDKLLASGLSEEEMETYSRLCMEVSTARKARNDKLRQVLQLIEDYDFTPMEVFGQELGPTPPPSKAKLVRASESNPVLIRIAAPKGPAFEYKTGRVYEALAVGKKANPYAWGLNPIQFPKALRENYDNLDSFYTQAGAAYFLTNEGKAELDAIHQQINYYNEKFPKK